MCYSAEAPWVHADCQTWGGEEFRVVSARSDQHGDLAWLTRLQRLADREPGGNLEWHTDRYLPGGQPGMTGEGVEPVAVHTLRCRRATAAWRLLSEAAERRSASIDGDGCPLVWGPSAW